MRKPIIAGNWKMNMTPSEAIKLVEELVPLINNAACDVVICPPFVDIPSVAQMLAGTNIGLGAQNMHFEEKGAYTGEVSVGMLKELGVQYVIIGHSERREYFNETDETVNKKVKVALKNSVTPIMCCGETLEHREGGITDAIISAQIRAGLDGISADDVKKTVVAYEPIWAIGTGKTASKEEAQETIAMIRQTIADMVGTEAAEAVRIQYGGSMNPKNVSELMAMPDIDGGLIGGAALKAEDFSKVVNY